MPTPFCIVIHMAKHNLKETKTDLLGQYYTVGAPYLLGRFAPLVKHRTVIDPFAGHWHLLDWARDNGASSVHGWDIELDNPRNQFNDYFQNPIETPKGALVLTNPPYLSQNRNKRGDRRPYEKYGQNDYYKCYLASLVEAKVDEAIVFMPTNFLCESSDKARKMFFKDYTIVDGDFWTHEIFAGVKISICVLHIRREKKQIHEFKLYNRTNGDVIDMVCDPKYKYLHGADFFEFIKDAPKYNAEKILEGMTATNNIVLSLLTKGKLPLGFHYNDGDPIESKPTAFTTYQVNLDVKLTKKQEKKVVELANEYLNQFRDQYKEMFIGFFIEGEQRIISRKSMHAILNKAIQEVTK